MGGGRCPCSTGVGAGNLGEEGIVGREGMAAVRARRTWHLLQFQMSRVLSVSSFKDTQLAWYHLLQLSQASRIVLERASRSNPRSSAWQRRAGTRQ